MKALRKFMEIKENEEVLDEALQDKLWNISMDLLKDNTTENISLNIPFN